MTAQELQAMLKKIQEPKGYFFNQDQSLVTDILEGLLANKENLGYMSCPCRLSFGDRQTDADIICPCKYREADVAEFGSCYCGLYVSKDWNEGKVERVYVPERRGSE